MYIRKLAAQIGVDPISALVWYNPVGEDAGYFTITFERMIHTREGGTLYSNDFGPEDLDSMLVACKHAQDTVTKLMHGEADLNTPLRTDA